MSMQKTIPRTFYSVQYLRGFGAMTVALWHGLSQLERTQPHLRYPMWGAIAVDIFFVISGFVMWHMTMAQPVSFGEYWRKRIVRAFPFYWLMTSLVVAVMLIAPSLLSSSRFDAAHVMASYLFLPWPHPVLHSQFAPVIIPGWTLIYEVAFYAVLGFGLFVPLRWRAGAVIGAIIAAALLPVFVTSSSFFFYFYTQPLIADFAVGVLIGWMLWNGYRFPAWLSLTAIGASFIAVLLMPSPSHFVPMIGGYGFMLSRTLHYLIPSFLIVAGAVFFDCARPDAKKWALLALIGDAAYSIYIVHVMVLPVVTRFWNMTGLQADWRWNGVYLMLAVAASTAVGILCYRAIEIPLFKFFDRITRRKITVPRQAATALEAAA
jgi:exopolysaccharide production protein ExoZ